MATISNSVFTQAAILLLLLLGPSAFATPSVNFCNFSAYKVTSYTLSWTDTQIKMSDMIVKPGHCRAAQGILDTHADSVRVYAEPVSNNAIYQYMRRLPKYRAVSRTYVTGWGGDADNPDLVVCIDQSDWRYEPSRQCDGPKERLLPFSDALRFNEQQVADYVLLDFALCELTQFECFNSDFHTLSNWAFELNQALASQRAFDKAVSGNHLGRNVGVIPTTMGVFLSRADNELALGVRIAGVSANTNPFGVPIPFQAGDRLISFDHKKVYSYKDLTRYLTHAGEKHGVERLVDVVFERAGQYLHTQVGLYFVSKAYPKFSRTQGVCQVPITSTYLTASNEFLFSKLPQASCLSRRIFNTHSNYEQCVFQRKQVLALLHQVCKTPSTWGAMLGYLTFPGKSQVNSALAKHVPFLSDKTIYTKMARAVLVEMSEESGRAIASAARDATTEDILREVVSRAQYQGLMAASFTMAPKLTGLAMIPIATTQLN